jgi:hypothetical protein
MITIFLFFRRSHIVGNFRKLPETLGEPSGTSESFLRLSASHRELPKASWDSRQAIGNSRKLPEILGELSGTPESFLRLLVSWHELLKVFRYLWRAFWIHVNLLMPKICTNLLSHNLFCVHIIDCWQDMVFAFIKKLETTRTKHMLWLTGKHPDRAGSILFWKDKHPA